MVRAPYVPADELDREHAAREAAESRLADTKARLAEIENDRASIEARRGEVDRAKSSVGHHHGEAYQIQVRYACEDLDLLRRRLRTLEADIERMVDRHDVGSLLTTIDGVGLQTAARLVAEPGDPALFRSAGALASYVGVVPALRQSGKRIGTRAGLTSIGHAPLRAKLWMPVLTGVRKNPWLRAYYQRRIARGKLPRVALVAAMRKLVAAVYTVAKQRRAFVPTIAEARR